MPRMRTTTHYDGAVQLDFYERRHKYAMNGVDVPGVTTITKTLAAPALVDWAARVTTDHFRSAIPVGHALSSIEVNDLCGHAQGAHKRALSESASFGTRIHGYAEAVALGTPEAVLPPEDEIEERCRRAVDAFYAWHVEKGPRGTAPLYRIEGSEVPVCSRELGYAGTVDLVMRETVRGHLDIWDFKTTNSKGVYPENALQLAAYRKAWNEEHPDDPIHCGFIVKLSKDEGEFRALPIAGRVLDRAEVAFTNLRQILDWQETYLD